MAHLAFRSRKHVHEHSGDLGDLDVPAHKVQRTRERLGQPNAVEGAVDGCASFGFACCTKPLHSRRLRYVGVSRTIASKQL
jgi:hypothetical protein